MIIPPDDIFTDVVSITDDVSEHSGPSRTYLSHVRSLYTAFRMSKIGHPKQSSEISGNASNMLAEHIQCIVRCSEYARRAYSLHLVLIRFQRLTQFKYASELNTFTYFHNKSRRRRRLRHPRRRHPRRRHPRWRRRLDGSHAVSPARRSAPSRCTPFVAMAFAVPAAPAVRRP